ncbi:hypothetical protein M2284_003450 [Rhodococcus sp. LBL1]|nr:hypothetical protein [Rhodococcus sp. LBL1]MDH6685026.1 hypothetical protein [Rhodococcus sp. LBL2]
MSETGDNARHPRPGVEIIDGVEYNVAWDRELAQMSPGDRARRLKMAADLERLADEAFRGGSRSE